jgi:hypothetical protein
MSDSNTKQYREFLADERNSAALYRTLAEIEKNPKIAEVYRRLAATEEAHAATWAEKLKAANVAVPPAKLGWRTRTLMWAAHRFGPGAVLPSMTAMEKRGDQLSPTRRSGRHGTPGTIARLVAEHDQPIEPRRHGRPGSGAAGGPASIGGRQCAARRGAGRE